MPRGKKELAIPKLREIEVDSTALPAEPFQATSIRSSTNQPLGQFRWLVWQVHSITPLGENTSFQEVQVIAP